MKDTSELQHLAIAEAGKIAALNGDHRSALKQYRDAMRLAVSAKSPEVFFRHYLEASLESLELMNDFESVLEYCNRAIAHYAAYPPKHTLAVLDLASTHQRKAAALIKSNCAQEARAELKQALTLAAQVGADMKLSKLLNTWLERGLTITPERILAEQRRLRYFSVRADTIGFVPAAVPTTQENDQNGSAEEGTKCSTIAS
jgi:hypothetical protein